MPEFVFRVTGIPLSARLSTLAGRLEKEFPNERVNQDDSRIVQSCYDDDSQTAFIQFSTDPPKKLSSLTDRDTYDLYWDRSANSAETLTIDKDFYNLTQLYNPRGHINADVVAVSGLNGHAYGSWRGRGNLRNMWLRDFLPSDLPLCRTMIFGCNTNFRTSGTHIISDYADQLLEELVKVRQKPVEKERPLVLIGHSFGGVIIAQAIVKARENESEFGSIFHNTRAIIFFGTPHRGLYVEDMLGMVKEGSPREQLIKSLEEGSSALNSELTRFINYCENIKIVTFHEADLTRRVVTDGNGRSTASGELLTRVNRGSSILQLPNKIQKVHIVEADHSDMIKFKNKHDRSYQSVVAHLKNFTFNADAATQTIQQGLNSIHLSPPSTPMRPTTPLTPATTTTTDSTSSTPAPEISTLPSSLRTPYSALMAGEVENLRQILSNNPSSANARQNNGTTTLLHIAIRNCDEASVKVLLEFPLNLAALDSQDGPQYTPLQLAADNGYHRIVSLILARLPGGTTREKVISMIRAVIGGHIETVELFLGVGIGTEERGDSGYTALHWAARHGHRKIIELLIKERANLISPDRGGMTPLHHAVFCSQADTVLQLLNALKQSQLSPDCRDTKGLTALCYAVNDSKNEGIVETLLKFQANHSISSDTGRFPIHIAAGGGFVKNAELLLKYGASFEPVDMYRTTPLHIAAAAGHTEVARVLLTAGAHVDVTDATGATPYLMAVSNQHMAVAQLIAEVRASRVAAWNQAQVQGAYANAYTGMQYGYYR